jgi:hypothetical protein
MLYIKGVYVVARNEIELGCTVRLIFHIFMISPAIFIAEFEITLGL